VAFSTSSKIIEQSQRANCFSLKNSRLISSNDLENDVVAMETSSHWARSTYIFSSSIYSHFILHFAPGFWSHLEVGKKVSSTHGCYCLLFATLSAFDSKPHLITNCY
jgi:hypothetical protein